MQTDNQVLVNGVKFVATPCFNFPEFCDTPSSYLLGYYKISSSLKLPKDHLANKHSYLCKQYFPDSKQECWTVYGSNVNVEWL